MSEQTVERNMPINIYVLQPSPTNQPGEPNYDATKKTWRTTYGQEGWTLINNVKDLIKHVKQKCGDRFFIRYLRIGGHGNPDSFRIGNQLIFKNMIDGLKPDFQEIIPYLKTGGSLICLDHCHVGQNDSLLKKVSEAFGGIPVIAPIEGQTTNEGVPLLEGAGRVCGLKKCFTIEKPGLVWRI